MKSAMQKSSFNQSIILFEVIWGLIAVLFFLLFSFNVGPKGYPEWYQYGTTILELVAFLVATLLCLRNALSPSIVSSRKVWWGLGLGMLCYFIGNLFFAYWELGLKREPDVSLGDLFYIPCYIFLMIGMGLAVFERRLNLEAWQYAVTAAVGAVGILIAVLLLASGEDKAAAAQLNPLYAPPAIAVETTLPVPSLVLNGDLLAQAKPKPTPAIKKPIAKPSVKPIAPVKAEDKVPAWVVWIEETLNPLKNILNFFYLMSDAILLIFATSLFLAFWGGRFGQSWRLIAAAAGCLYIADAWFKFATEKLDNYQSGGLLEVGWILSAVLFGLGAALEFQLSQSRRNTGRRRA
jgi:hypothetical protein